jgi:hypothetical protein
MAKTPRKIVEAFSAGGANVAGIELREFTISTLILMEKIACPLLGKSVDGKPMEMSNLDVLRLLFILSKAPAECHRSLSHGLPVFDESVMEFGSTISVQQIKPLGAQIQELFLRAMSTAPTGSSDSEKKTGREATATPSPTSRKAAADTAGS